jgi:hypothetical protein
VGRTRSSPHNPKVVGSNPTPATNCRRTASSPEAVELSAPGEPYHALTHVRSRRDAQVFDVLLNLPAGPRRVPSQRLIEPLEALLHPPPINLEGRRYSSHLTTWRAGREREELAGPKPKKRGPVAQVVDARDKRIAELERETTRWRKRAERAEALIEVQKYRGIAGKALATEPW